MNKLCRSVTLAAGILAMAPHVRAQEMIHEDGEDGEVFGRVHGTPPEAVNIGDEARNGSWVQRSRVTGGVGTPNELQRSETSTGREHSLLPGETYWVGFSVKLGEDFRGLGAEAAGMLFNSHFRQWRADEADCVRAETTSIRYLGDERFVLDNELVGHIYMGSIAVGVWTDFVMQLRFHDTEGRIVLWQDGVQVLDWTGENFDNDCISGAYLKLGLYSYQLDNPDSLLDAGVTRTVFHGNCSRG